MKQSEVRREFGRPKYWLNTETGKYFESVIEYKAARDVYGMARLLDVYERRIHGNLYEVEVGYEYDSSVSRLYPEPRVTRIIFEADRPGTIARLLVDFPEIGDVCKPGCFAKEDPADHYGPGKTSLVPVVITDAEKSAGQYLQEASSDTSYRTFIFFEWESHAAESAAWSERTVTSARIMVRPGTSSDGDYGEHVWTPGSMDLADAPSVEDLDAAANSDLRHPAQPPSSPAPPVDAKRTAMSPALLKKEVIPSYPPLARQARVEGIVRFSATVGKDGGRVQQLALISGPPLLVPAATDAVKEWIYQPASLDGESIESRIEIEVPFKLQR